MSAVLVTVSKTCFLGGCSPLAVQCAAGNLGNSLLRAADGTVVYFLISTLRFLDYLPENKAFHLYCSECSFTT